MLESPGRPAWFYLWRGGPGLYKKEPWPSSGDQASNPINHIPLWSIPFFLNFLCRTVTQAVGEETLMPQPAFGQMINKTIQKQTKVSWNHK